MSWQSSNNSDESPPFTNRNNEGILCIHPQQQSNNTDIDDQYAREKDTNIEPSPPPDGGFKAWLHVLLGHLVFFNTWGVINSFGVFQQYYEQTLTGRPAPSDVAWIGSVPGLSPLLRRRLCRTGHGCGIFPTGLPLRRCPAAARTFMTSLCTKYWQIFLGQAVCVGLGHGFIFGPALSVMSSYFLKKRALAVGLAAAGGATGGLVYPAVVNKLL
ncbi:hypothetical protein VTN77DRAFT_9754 [Rasamsonia byssochlamydoides]|uniref:uncharacterized protein n=1 Tax=Rasamsonia byssochlamydoides TaxID=89139 RepID=UPI00374402BC